jgi:hypothetical protein
MRNVEQLENNLNYAKEGIELAEGIDKLFRNPTFKKVILQGYFEKEAIRLVSLLSDPSMQDEDNQTSIQNAMRGIGELRSWLNAMSQRATQLEKMKYDIEKEIQHITDNPTELELDSDDE